jgi:hypothetical protein
MKSRERKFILKMIDLKEERCTLKRRWSRLQGVLTLRRKYEEVKKNKEKRLLHEEDWDLINLMLDAKEYE